MPKFKNYSAALVERQIRAIARRNPENINPQGEDGMTCLYHDGRGANIRRCLIGQWGKEQGFRTPPANYGTAEDVVGGIWSKEATFTDEAVDLMVRYQEAADMGFDNELVPVPWGEVLELS